MFFQFSESPLKGAEFKVEFFAQRASAVRSEAMARSSEMKAYRTWIFRTDKEGKIKFTKDYLVSGDEFYYQSDGKTPCIPLGHVRITEMKAPEGYRLTDEIFTADIISAGVKETVKVYNTQTAAEQVKRAGISNL